MQTRKQLRRKIICYTGRGSRKNYIHTRKQFMNIWQRKSERKQCNYYNKLGATSMQCPSNRNNLNAWINYSGAEYMTPKQCKKLTSTSKYLN